MIVDPSEFISFGDWFPGAMMGFLQIVLVLIGIGLVVGYATTVLRHGPTEAIYILARAVVGFFSREGARSSPRRVLALAQLAVKESLRRRVLVVFGVFVVVMLFAGWMLDVENDHPARLYLGFVLTMSNYLVLALAMFLSAFSLPNDIKDRTIYTITTKPVRPMEIYWGRVFGFVGVGTVLLLAMGLISGVFVYRGLHHTHEIDTATVKLETSSKSHSGETQRNSHHRHEFSVSEQNETDGKVIGATNPIVMEHRHPVTLQEDGSFEVGSPQGSLRARVPIYGTLRFHDRDGNPDKKGLSVGKEWTYRSYIEGYTLSAAVWTFSDVTIDKFPKGLPLEMDIRVFRTNKGDIKTKISGEIILRNPDPASNMFSMPILFSATEFAASERFVSFDEIKGQDNNGQLTTLDLFNDLVDKDGNLEVWIRCREHAQYFGMAQADVYLKAEDNSFWMNFTKSYLGLWMQMVLVVLFGVFFSTFLTGIVALQATLATIVLGMFGGFMADIQSGEVAGGGPLEALLRNANQQGVTTELDVSEGTSIVMKWVDHFYMQGMTGISRVLPNYPEFNTVRKVAYGYDINHNIIARHCVITLGYFLVLSVMGYFVLRTREFAA
jgi:hypothetical protein